MMARFIVLSAAVLGCAFAAVCYFDTNKLHYSHTSNSTTHSCDSDYCVKNVTQYDGYHESDWGCGIYICPKGAGSHTLNGHPEHVYCCKGDKCNGAVGVRHVIALATTTTMMMLMR